jgi:hypothetical protein
MTRRAIVVVLGGRFCGPALGRNQPDKNQHRSSIASTSPLHWVGSAPA